MRLTTLPDLVEKLDQLLISSRAKDPVLVVPLQELYSFISLFRQHDKFMECLNEEAPTTGPTEQLLVQTSATLQPTRQDKPLFTYGNVDVYTSLKTSSYVVVDRQDLSLL